MPSDKEQKKSPEEEAEEKKYSFLQEKIKGKQGSRETLIKQFIRIAIYGLILGMFACLGFFALKPWMQQWFAGNFESNPSGAEEKRKIKLSLKDWFNRREAEGYRKEDFYETSTKTKKAIDRILSDSDCGADPF